MHFRTQSLCVCVFATPALRDMLVDGEDRDDNVVGVLLLVGDGVI